MPEFTTRWFRQSDRTVWMQHLAYLRERPTRYLEIGVFEGYSFCWVLRKLLTHPESCACGVDTWSEVTDPIEVDMADVEARARCNVEPYGDKVQLFKANSAAFLLDEIKIGRSYDLLYIDGCHRLECAWVDTGLAWQVLSEGGVLVWDDYKREIQRAVDVFIELVGAEVLWSTRRQLAVRKKS